MTNEMFDFFSLIAGISSRTSIKSSRILTIFPLISFINDLALKPMASLKAEFNFVDVFSAVNTKDFVENFHAIISISQNS